MNVIDNPKAILREVAAVMVEKKQAVMRLVRNYLPDQSIVTNADYINAVVMLFETSEQFQQDFASIMLDKGYYTNVTAASYSNAADPVTAIADAIGSIFKFGGTVAGRVGAKKEAREGYEAQLLHDIMEAEAKKGQGNPVENWILGGLILGSLAFGALIIYKTKTKA